MARERAVRRFASESAEATEALGEALASLLGAGDVVALHGELGAGKTCFVRGLARGLGVEVPVASPTFTLMHTYVGRVPMYHLDAWMQARGEAFLADGGAEWLRANGVAAIEWAERVADWLPEARFEVRLGHVGVEQRSIEVEGLGACGERVARLAVPSSLRELAAHADSGPST